MTMLRYFLIKMHILFGLHRMELVRLPRDRGYKVRCSGCGVYLKGTT